MLSTLGLFLADPVVWDIVGLKISASDFIWTIISFLLFMFLLNKVLLKPVMSFMDARKARIDAGLEEGKKAKKALDDNDVKLRQELVQASTDARAVVNSARSEAEKAKDEKLSEAHAQAEEIRRKARENVKNSESAAETEIDDSMAEFVSLLSDKLVGGGSADNKDVIDSVVAKSKE